MSHTLLFPVPPMVASWPSIMLLGSISAGRPPSLDVVTDEGDCQRMLGPETIKISTHDIDTNRCLVSGIVVLNRFCVKRA